MMKRGFLGYTILHASILALLLLFTVGTQTTTALCFHQNGPYQATKTLVELRLFTDDHHDIGLILSNEDLNMSAMELLDSVADRMQFGINLGGNRVHKDGMVFSEHVSRCVPSFHSEADDKMTVELD